MYIRVRVRVRECVSAYVYWRMFAKSWYDMWYDTFRKLVLYVSLAGMLYVASWYDMSLVALTSVSGWRDMCHSLTRHLSPVDVKCVGMTRVNSSYDVCHLLVWHATQSVTSCNNIIILFNMTSTFKYRRVRNAGEKYFKKTSSNGVITVANWLLVAKHAMSYIYCFSVAYITTLTSSNPATRWQRPEALY